MEIRKIQLTGKSTYIVSLPKKWVEKYKIKKNDSVSLTLQKDGRLVIVPKEKEIETKEINVDNLNDGTLLFRILVSTYVNGYSNIILKSEKEISPFIRERAIKFTRKVIGMEITDEDEKTITIKYLFDPKEMPLDNTINRMFSLTKAMHESAILSLKNKDKNIAENTIKMDKDIDRAHWFVFRQFNTLLKNSFFSEKINLTYQEGMYYFLISRLIERIADHAVKIAENSIPIINENIDKEIINIISSQSEISMKIFDDAFEAWKKKDINLANKNINSINEFVSQCEKINEEIAKKQISSIIHITNIVESIRRTGEYSADISEVVMNSLF
ncbi:MAG: PhoU domain-containing protein [Candidatus Altarchaeaceae archaeon]